MMDWLSFDVPSFTVTIPSYVFLVLSGLLGTLFMWLSQRAERRGIRVLSPNGDADCHFRCYGRYQTFAYIMVLVFLYLMEL